MALRSSAFVKRLFIGAASAAFVSLTVVPSGGADEVPQTADAPQGFDIPSQPLSEALAEFARQSKINVVAPSALTRGRTSSAVSGEMPPAEALRRLANNAAFDIHAQEDGSFILVQAVAGDPKSQPLRLAQSTLPTAPSDPAEDERPQRNGDPDAERDAGRSEEERRLGRVTVTGTLIRGLAPESSPLQIFSREEIDASGVTTLEQFVRSLPENYGGGSMEFAPGGLPNDVNTQRNSTFGSGANLRGLGSGGTLVLLNGSRIAPTSQVGDFVDISLIPLSAIERVDVLTDGASSIYGGDAVAGVINFVLRDDYRGAETSVRYGSVTKGDLEELRVSQTVGRAWDSGNALATYEYFDRSSLSLASRSKIAPPTTIAGVPIADLDHFDLLPLQQRNSGVIAFNQQLSPELRVHATGLYSHRKSKSRQILAAGIVAKQEADSKTENITVTGGGDYDIDSNWTASLTATYSQMQSDRRFAQWVLPNPPQRGSVVETDSSIWTADLLFNGDLLTLPGGPVKTAFGAHYREEEFENALVGSLPNRVGDRTIVSAYAEVLVPFIGTQNAVPWVERLELNLSGRIDDYSDFGSTSNPKIGVLWSPKGGINFRGSYGTSFAPPALGNVGAIDRAALVSFYAHRANLTGSPIVDPALDVAYLFISGTADGLQPETSRTYTGGVDFSFESSPASWSGSATYYDVSFDDRLGRTPIPGNVNVHQAPNIAWGDPSAFPPGAVIFFPSLEQVQQLMSTINRPINFEQGTTADTLDDIGIISTVNLIRNLTSTKTTGLDARIRYERDTDFGRFAAGLNANYIIDFTRQATQASPEVSILNTWMNPIDLHIKGHLGLSRENSSGSLTVNHMASYRTDDTPAAVSINSWTTVDLTLRYALSALNWAPLETADISLAVINLFDEPPPKAPTIGTSIIAGYDPTNASPLGRFVAIQLRTKF